MNVPGIKKYYIGFFILLALAAACLVYAVSQAGAAKADKKTNAAVEQISQKLETYIADKGNVPDNLQAAGIKDVPDTVKYTRLDSQKYQVCLDYKAASSGFDAGWLSLLGGGFDSSGSSSAYSDHSYFDSSVEFKHTKGKNCQTVNANSFGANDSSFTGSPSNFQSSPSTTGATNSCDSSSDSFYQFQGETTVDSVNKDTQTIVFSASGQSTKDSQGNSVPSGIRNKSYDSFTLFCAANGESSSASAIKDGQKIKFFASSDLSVLDKVELE